MRPLVLIVVLASGAALAEDRAPASVLDPQTSSISKQEAEVLGEAIRDTVVGAAKFRVQDRAAMREILAQQKFNASDACDESCAVEQGRLLQVRFLVTSTARRVEDEVWISVRMTDVQSGEVVGTARDSCACKLKEMVRMAEGLTRKVLGLPSGLPAPAPPPPPPMAAIPAPPAAEQVMELVALDGQKSFDVEVRSRSGVTRCTSKVTSFDRCKLRDVPPGQVDIFVKGDGEFSASLNIPRGRSVVELDERGYGMTWTGIGVFALFPLFTFGFSQECPQGFLGECTGLGTMMFVGVVASVVTGMVLVLADLGAPHEVVRLEGEDEQTRRDAAASAKFGRK